MFTFQYDDQFIHEKELECLQPFVETAHNMIHQKTGFGKEWLGWLDYPITYDEEALTRVKEVARRIRKMCDVFVVIGIGGSYLGSRAGIELLSSPFFFQQNKDQPEIYYVGHHLSADYIYALFSYLRDKEICVNVISKSGTTLEPAVTFRLFRQFMKEKYGDESYKRIFATTDSEKGVLRKISQKEGYETFVVPGDIGGRYSVLTPVGLLPMAVSNVPIDEVIKGASMACDLYSHANLMQNSCYVYAACRHILYQKGKVIELLVNYDPRLSFFCEWWKQLFGESEGKNGKGVFPASLSFTTDLHSLGQYIQEGPRHLFETALFIDNVNHPITIEDNQSNDDGLEYLTKKTVHSINAIAFDGTVKAHRKGGVPVSLLRMEHVSPQIFGGLVYFFQKSCALSGYLLGVNPFDQPGVEVYKKEMKHSLKR